MKQYIIDDLRPEDCAALKTSLDKRFGPADLGRIYWIPLEAGLLTAAQSAHTECQPLYFAIDLDDSRLACELLVRSKHRLRCDCIRYATQHQRNWLIGWVDDMFERLQIKT